MKKARSQSSRGTSGRSSSSNGKSTSSRSSSTKKSTASTSGRSSTGSRSTGSSSRSSSGSKSSPGSRSNTKASSNGRSTNGRSTTSNRSSSSRASANGRATASRSNGKSTSSRSRKQSSPAESLMDVLKDNLKDIFYAEKQMIKNLKKVSKAATNAELKECFDLHREQTENQIALLEQAFEALEMRASGKKCPAMDGLVEEAKEHIEELDKGPALDAALIVGAQKAEHYEIAAYGSLRSFARTLGLTECEQIFDQILSEDSETDELLTQVAQTVNREALAGSEMEMAEMEEEQM